MLFFGKKKKKEAELPDFSDVTSYQKAIALVHEEKLKKINTYLDYLIIQVYILMIVICQNIVKLSLYQGKII